MASKEQLVATVKAWQKSGAQQKEMWYNYCGQNGTTNYDPNRHDEAFLANFITLTEASPLTPEATAESMGEPSEEKTALVAKVKQWQRLGPMQKQMWWSYCASNGSQKKDPNLHDETFLTNFLNMTETGDFSGMGGDAGDDGEPKDKDALVAQVKNWQRMGPMQKQMWYNYVDCNGGESNYDPNRHEATFLSSFLQNAQSGALMGMMNPMMGMMGGGGKGGGKKKKGGGGPYGGGGMGMGGGMNPMMAMMAMMGGMGGGGMGGCW